MSDRDSLWRIKYRDYKESEEGVQEYLVRAATADEALNDWASNVPGDEVVDVDTLRIAEGGE